MPSMRSVGLSLAGLRLPAGSWATAMLAAPQSSGTTPSAPNARASHHETDDHTGAGQRWRPAAPLLLSACHGERAGGAHVDVGGLDPAVGTLDMGDAELVDTAIEGIGDAAQVPADAKGS
jgi:hypothetical protein